VDPAGSNSLSFRSSLNLKITRTKDLQRRWRFMYRELYVVEHPCWCDPLRPNPVNSAPHLGVSFLRERSSGSRGLFCYGSIMTDTDGGFNPGSGDR
jgi:hypothetical protein